MLDNETQYIESMKKLSAISADIHNNAELRSRVENGDVAPVMDALGVEVPQGMEVRVFCNTAEAFYLALPSDPGMIIRDKELTGISGGASASTVSTMGCLGCFPSTASSASSVGSAGSHSGSF